MTTTPHTLNNERYRIERVLGAGGMSLVFLAQDTRLGVQRAIKLLRRPFAKSPEIRSRFLNEAFAQADLRHPNILMVHDIVEDEETDSIFLVMELADGGSLADRVMTKSTMSPREAAQVGITIGTALSVAHNAGVIHRDIKPGNMLIDRHGVLKLADFGIAQIQSREQLTRTGVSIGTWSFMPPEQRVDARDADARADIYALGGSLFYLMTGRNPDALHNRETHVVAFASIPPVLASVIKKATRFEPTDRYQSCDEMIAALRFILDAMSEEPVVNLKPAPRPRPLSLDEVLSSYYTEAGGQLPAKHDRAKAIATGSTFIPHPDDQEFTNIPALTAVPDQGPPSQINPPIAPPLAPPPPAGRSMIQASLAGLVAAVATVAMLAWLILPQLLPPQPVVPQPTGQVPPELTLPELTPPGGQALLPEETPPDGQALLGQTPPEQTPPEQTPPARGTTTPRTISGPRIISVLPGASSPTTDPGSAPTLSSPKASTGTVIIRTIPSGATVRAGGERLSGGAGGYALSVGRHTLAVESAAGEVTHIPVEVRAGKTVEICYNFDTNSACVN